MNGSHLDAEWNPFGSQFLVSGEDDDETDDEGAKRDRITLNPRPATRRYLKALVRLGVYGKTPTTAASRLVDEGIRRAIADGLIGKEQEDD